MKTGILLIHGVTGAPAEMRYLGSHLSSLGFEIESPTLPGHGAGKKELFSTKAEDWVAASAASFRELKKRCEHVFVVGLCVGACISGLVASLEDRIDGVVFLSAHYGKIAESNTKLRYFLPLIYLSPWLRRTIYRDQGPGYGLQDTRLRSLIAESLDASGTCERGMFVTYIESFYQSDRLAKMLRRSASKIKCPALFIHSLEDTWVSPDNAVSLANDISSKDKTVLMINGCDHVITIDLKRRHVADQVGLFVERVVQQLDEQKTGPKVFSKERQENERQGKKLEAATSESQVDA